MDYYNYKGAIVDIPKSIAIIPDGNRRWAKKRMLPPVAGHKKGAEVFKQVIKDCYKRGVKYITFYAFSTENWKRQESEVNALMSMLRGFLDNYENELEDGGENIRIKVIGDRSRLSKELNEGIDRVERVTDCHEGITVAIAINYGSRDELVNAARQLAGDCVRGTLRPEDINEELFESRLYLPEIPDPDLLIRTSGEERVSNFLLWQLAYSEFYFADCLWPDFDEKELDKAFEEFAGRKRRYGS